MRAGRVEIGQESLDHGDKIWVETAGQLGMTNTSAHFVEDAGEKLVTTMSGGWIRHGKVTKVVSYDDLSESQRPIHFTPARRKNRPGNSGGAVQ